MCPSERKNGSSTKKIFNWRQTREKKRETEFLLLLEETAVSLFVSIELDQDTHSSFSSRGVLIYHRVRRKISLQKRKRKRHTSRRTDHLITSHRRTSIEILIQVDVVQSFEGRDNTRNPIIFTSCRCTSRSSSASSLHSVLSHGDRACYSIIGYHRRMNRQILSRHL